MQNVLNMSEDTAKLHSVPRLLRSGEWVDIGHLSALRLVRNKARVDLFDDVWMLHHKFEGRITARPLSWLTVDMPLLNLALKKTKKAA